MGVRGLSGRWAAIGITAFFAAVSVLGLAMTRQGQQDASHIDSAVRLMSELQNVQYLAGQEHAGLADYLSGGGGAPVAAAQVQAMERTDLALHGLAGHAPADWRPLIAQIESAQASYRRLAGQEMSLIGSGDLGSATQMDDTRLDPAAAALGSLIGDLERKAAGQGSALTAQIDRDTTRRMATTPVVLGISWLLAMAYVFALRRYQRRLAHAARTDHLTRLANRAQLHETCDRAVAHADGRGAGPALLLLDLDHFKEVNDTLGHHVGDDLLVQAAQRLGGNIPPDALACRLGGDEFAVVLGDADRAEAKRTAVAIREAIQLPFTLEGVVVDVDVSIGIATFHEGASTSSLLRQADVAMYVAKESGSGVSVYKPTLDDHTTQRLALMGEMRHALDHEELVVHYQPKINVADNSVVGAEALVRWQHPSRGLLLPSEFIPHVETTHVIYRLTLYVLKRTLAQCRQWLDDGRTIPVAVNVAARCLLDPEFPDTVADNLRRFDLDPRLLTLEVTETTVITDLARARRAMEQLHQIGVGFALDDYGTGYSAMAYVKELPLTELKVDRHFVEHLATTEADAALVRSVIQMGHSLGLKVVAEGVEDPAARTRLQLLDCDMAQGYCIARPMPAAELSVWLEEQGPATAASSDARSRPHQHQVLPRRPGVEAGPLPPPVPSTP